MKRDDENGHATVALPILACAALASGCVSYRASKVTAITGGEVASIVCVAFGAILAISGVIVMAAHGRPTQSRRTQP